MLTLYAATGMYKLKTRNQTEYPVILMNGTEYELDLHEILLWSCLQNQILTLREIKKAFYQAEDNMHVLGEMNCEYYLERLCAMGLVISGSDDTGVDALYNLLANYYVKPTHKWLLLPKKNKLQESHLLSKNEKSVLKMSRHHKLCTAQIIQRIEKNTYSAGANDAIYDDSTSNCDNLMIATRFCKQQLNVITAIANLYMRKQIILESA